MTGTFTIPGSDITNCELLWTGPTRESYIWFTIILAFLLPTIAKISFAIPILTALGNTSSTQTEPNQYQGFANRNRKSTVFILIITLVHMVLWLPLWISLISINLMPANIHPDNATILLHLLSGCIGIANTVINPILYFKLNTDFQDGLFKLIKCIPNYNDGNGFASDGMGQNGGATMDDRSNGGQTVTKFDNVISN